MASPSPQRSKSPTAARAARRKAATEAAEARKRTELTRLPFKRWIPAPANIFAIFHRYGVTGGLVVLKILERTVGDFKAGRPTVAEISDSDFLEATNTSDEQLRKIKRRLEEDQVIPARPEGSGRDREYSVNFKVLDRLAKEGVAPRENPKNREKCRPRTAPAVLVQVPGSTGLVPIDEACTTAGGWGKLCDCPLHRVQPQAETAPAALESPAPDPSPPAAEECRAHTENAQKEAKTPINREGDPNYSWGETKAKPEAGQVNDRKLTAAELLAAVEPLCYEVWRRSPAGGPLLTLTVEALEGNRDAIPFLLKRIAGCKGKARKEDGLLPHLAKDALKDFAADQVRAGEAEQEEAAAEARRRFRADRELKTEEAVNAAIAKMGAAEFEEKVQAKAKALRKAHPLLLPEHLRATAEAAVRSDVRSEIANTLEFE